MTVHPTILPTAFDPHFKVFHELMPFKVQEILLVSSLYDAFIMEEDGSITTRLIHEYHGLNLSKAPKVTRVSTGEEALEVLARKRYDLVITMPYLSGMNAFELGRRIKENRPRLPVILMAHNLRSVYPLPLDYQANHIDNIFLWCCEDDLLMAIIKNVEDHANVDNDTARAMVRVIIYVEDSPDFRSLFLPAIYREVVQQTQAVLDESINERHRLLRMRARPKILMAHTYEDARRLYEAYQPYVFAVISDARFPRNGRIDACAGERLLADIRAEVPDLPLLMISSEEQNRIRAESIPAVFIAKQSSEIYNDLHEFCLTYLGFGDFIFRMPDGTPVCSASNVMEFERAVGMVPEASLRYHAVRNHFSNWMMARSEVGLARQLHRDFIGDINKIPSMRDDIVEKVRALRRLRQKGVITGFDPEHYDPEITEFVKIGNGPIGGKARGLAFIWACLQRPGNKHSILKRYPAAIPKTAVVTAQGFDDFISQNQFTQPLAVTDEHIADLFIDGRLPSWLRQELEIFLQRCDFPLSVRSSSLLEDGQFRPYAGLYSTYFLANNHPDFSIRLGQLESAIKMVYASIWFESPQAYSRGVGSGSREDLMAVIIQELVGKDYNGRWYPAISGVAQSHNYYPVQGMLPDEGIAHIALGIGKTVVEGEKNLRFSPAYPQKLIQFSAVEDVLANCQRQLYALDLSSGDCLNRYNANLVRYNVQDVAPDLPVQLLASTYIPDEHRIRDVDMPGVKILTFAQILKYSAYPLGDILLELLAIGRSGMGSEVEIEFAVQLGPTLAESTFYLLQIRPMVTGAERVDVVIHPEDAETAIVYSTQSLGHGQITTIRDIIYVKPDTFDTTATRDIAREIGQLNRQLVTEKRHFLLVGPGRWGTNDHWLGIPVQWSDISNVQAIVEVRNRQLRADPSQGSHFFQNLTSLGIPYLTVDENNGSKEADGQDRIDWQWLQQAAPTHDGRWVRHLRLQRPLSVTCDGRSSVGMISKRKGASRPQPPRPQPTHRQG
ncbi:PEP/pyruvate-binding domain-containing protein [Desulfofustis glycolicus]|uniref:Response regulator receiver domain-containing protein n=1 Tax=Desulfofustis glycolicus DSM 9705 TaxID=1121409 RepID=A0A1M5VAE7_9BACT|nr:PEP/pyruvate-binding domain-containing protein [Desulfofustis glycolicus]MCB2218220.1 response regulator [Desulfobulbaceae bacterium]SHH72210.1 Response regulator receiver domain-containing protein [Desulfofustis glycolicus DSM 9705]